ncbi:MAG TPA: hypothetical protein VG937_26560 [Polyangiaceae bacterium]|nr:hypothetical protein [Polyangiaceae bacterium]
MSARRGSLTLTRLYVKGALPADLRQRYLKAVRLRAFQPLKPDDEAVEASGWCVFERPFDLEFHTANLFEDQFVVLGFRIDRYRVPGAMVRGLFAEEEQRLLARSGKNRLSRNERLELKEKIVLKLRRKLTPSTKAIDVVWDLDGGSVLFFSHARRTLADFTALFEKTFGIQLVEDSPYIAAERLELPARLMKAIEHIEPVRLSGLREAPAEPDSVAVAKGKPAQAEEAAEEEEQDELFQRIETTRFLGAEFLLWIWLRGEFVQSGIELGDLGEFNVWIDQQLVLESPLDRNERVTIRGVAPADGTEAREAVRARKFPVRARVVLQAAERESVFSLVAPRFAIAGGTVPNVATEEPSDAIVERMALAQRLFGVIDRLYGAFLQDRLSDTWSLGWEPAISAWLEGTSVPASILQKLAPAAASERRGKKRRSA